MVSILRQGPFPFVQTRFDEREGQFSPDTRWVAYQSDESGRYQFYPQAFPGPGEPIPVTADGGTQPRWRPDGRELFYISPDERLMALPLELDADGRLPRVLAPVPLFQTQISGGDMRSPRRLIQAELPIPPTARRRRCIRISFEMLGKSLRGERHTRYE